VFKFTGTLFIKDLSQYTHCLRSNVVGVRWESLSSFNYGTNYAFVLEKVPKSLLSLPYVCTELCSRYRGISIELHDRYNASKLENISMGLWGSRCPKSTVGSQPERLIYKLVIGTDFTIP
jgi:hypothetical protein